MNNLHIDPNRPPVVTIYLPPKMTKCCWLQNMWFIYK